MSTRIRSIILSVAAAGAIGCAAIAPAVASAGLVDGVLDQVHSTVDNTVKNISGNGGSSDPVPAPAAAPTAPSAAGATKAGTPPSYVPPAHGSNPHGQGTGVVADLTPSQSEPLPYEPGGGTEDAIVGSSRGEQKGNGKYHGHVTIVGLLGMELIEGADTQQGEESDGPLGDVNSQLNQICTASDICLTALGVHSKTTKTGSTNSFDAATADVGLMGSNVVSADAVHSDGTISEDSNCQTSDGQSTVANAGALGAVNANALNASTSSVACNDGSNTQENDSSAVGVNGVGVLAPVGCEDGTADQNFGVPVVLDAVCGADDGSNSGGAQNDAPYGVREALTLFPLTGLVKATTSTGESQAVAPGDDNPGNPGNPGTSGNPPATGNPNEPQPTIPDLSKPGQPDSPATPNGPSASTPSDALPFTGADLGTLSLVGFSVMALGLGLMAMLDRRRRQARVA